MKELFVSSVEGPAEKADPAYWFVFQERKMLVVTGKLTNSVPRIADIRNTGIKPIQEIYLGSLNGIHCYAAGVDESIESPEGMAFHGLWGLHGHVEEALFRVAFRAIHTIEWDKADQYCSRCGSKNQPKIGERAKECPQCGDVSFPRISPAIIVLVEREGKALLARSGRFKEGLFSAVAGFVEPGESLEDAVHREVKEETGIDVKNIRYFGSQPWPFPDSLMVGFTAEYAGGEIKIDDNEILDARWFPADGMPEIPGKISIARALIDWFVENEEERKNHAKEQKKG
jgi:NAD+ diphosphatase